MEKLPLITIVTPSYNQGAFIAETIESILEQDYPNLEHIVMDGGSEDETLDILKRYSHLKVISEKDHGQADAINKGFNLATGKIFGFLNSDDTLLPGTLHRVAQEIDPERGRHMIMGRCRFIDENGKYFGIEHPSKFENHCRVLQVWKGYMIPQPAVFWTREVWERCGGMDLSLKYHLDYDLFCRMTKYYRIHSVDQVFATYRLHPESKTEAWTEADRLEDSIKLSRRHWGSPLSLRFWQLTFSHAWYRFNRVERARSNYLKFVEYRRQQQTLQGIPSFLLAAGLAPDVAFYVGVYPKLREKASGVFQAILARLGRKRRIMEQTAVYFDQTSVWNDGWVGPKLVMSKHVESSARTVIIQGNVNLTFMGEPLSLALKVDGKKIRKWDVDRSGDFVFQTELPFVLDRGDHTIEVIANTWFVPFNYSRAADYRPLVWLTNPATAITLS